MIEYILLFIFIYSVLNNLSFFGIYGVPGSNQINISHLFKYYTSLYKKNSNQKIKLTENLEEGYQTIFGYCCRQLFNSFILDLKKNSNKKLNIGVSPIHHTSFRNIIEENFPEENIHIFDIDEKYEKITIPENKKHINYDLIVITHLWGKYLNIEEIVKNNEKTLIIEDVVLGGEFKYEFKNNSDLLFHSCGMDKRPSSIFGGYVHIKKTHKNIIENMVKSISSLELPSKKEIKTKLDDTTILYLLYNFRPLQNITKLILYIMGYKLSNITQQIRKNKPGFEHSNYMKCPNNLMLNIDKSIYNTQNNTEKLFIKKNKLFLDQFSKNKIIKYFPWNSNDINRISCLPYNPVYIDEKYHQQIIDYFDYNNTCIIKNPTYKTFKHSDKKIQKFLDNILYLPCLYNLSSKEIINITVNLKKIISEIE